MTRNETMYFKVAFSYALAALFAETPHLGWTAEEKAYGKTLLTAGKIEGSSRIVQDRFARVFQDCRISPEEYETLRRECFSFWTSWTGNKEEEFGRDECPLST